MKKYSLSIRAFSVVLCATLFGCATNPYNVRPIDQSLATKRHVSEKNYKVGQEQTAYVGQPIARVKDYDVEGKATPSFTSPISISTSWWAGQDHVYPEGTELQAAAMMTYEKVTYYIATLNPPLYQNVGLLLNLEGQYRGNAITNNGIVFHPCDLGAVCVRPNEIDFKKSTHETVLSTSKFVNFEIVYSGATKDTLNLLYREYTPEDMARPAFTQNLTYDRTSPSIRFREMQIRVIEASNESLRYVVEADGLAQ